MLSLHQNLFFFIILFLDDVLLNPTTQKQLSKLLPQYSPSRQIHTYFSIEDKKINSMCQP